MYSTHAIRFVQNGRVFYVAAIPAARLVELTKVDVWSAEKPYEGYQRSPTKTRVRAIAKYVTEPDAILPIGGLVNARPKGDQDADNAYGTVLRFEKDRAEGEVAFGTLTIPDSTGPLFIVDMQHRLAGLRMALEEGQGELDDYPMVVTIADGLSRLEEVEQFDLINTTQKKVRTDLARRLLAYQMKEDLDKALDLDQKQRLWEAKGPVITDILNKKEGVWYQRILPPNMSKKDMPTIVVRETSFVSSLKPVLQTPYFSRQNEEHAAEMISRFWEALRQVFPEAFETPENYSIQMTTGVSALHQIAPEVFELARDRGDISVDSLQGLLLPLRDAVGGSDFWHRDNEDGAVQFLGSKGFRTLAAILRQELPQIELEL